MNSELKCPSCLYSGSLNDFTTKNKIAYLNGFLLLDKMEFQCPSCKSKLTLNLSKKFINVTIVALAVHFMLTWYFLNFAVFFAGSLIASLLIIKKYLYKPFFKIKT